MDQLYRIRHSLAHILAQAVQEFRPGTQLGFGPPTENGFYYDFALSGPLSEKDFPVIEMKMRAIIAEGTLFQREQLSQEESLHRLNQMREPFKREYAEELIRRKNLSDLSFYRSGKFIDLCEGPHVVRTDDIPVNAFKLQSIAGAYWRGNSARMMMTRIYAWAFEDEPTLLHFIENHTKPLERDHKKLGKEQPFSRFRR